VPVDIQEGTFSALSYFSGEFTGIYQDVAVQPGQIFAAGGWFYVTEWEPFSGTNETYLEVQFRAGNTVLQQYVTEFIDATTASNAWFHLKATNAGTYGSTPPTSDAEYLVVPPGRTPCASRSPCTTPG